MYDFVIHIVFVVSMGVMIYLLARALPRVSDDQGALASGFFDRLVDRLPLDRIDIALSAMLERILRKVRILILKMDNVINSYIEQVRRHSPVTRTRTTEDMKEKIEAMQDGVEKIDK